MPSAEWKERRCPWTGASLRTTEMELGILVKRTSTPPELPLDLIQLTHVKSPRQNSFNRVEGNMVEGKKGKED